MICRWSNRYYVPWLALAAVLGASLACNLPFLDQTPPSPEALEPGGSVRGLDGVLLGATADAIETPIEVSIELEAAPASLPALPDDVRQVGDIYRVGADSEILVSADESFVVGLPVPEGTEPEKLALAIFVPEELVEGHEEGDSVPVWSFIDGFYDADTGLLLGATGALNIEGQPVTIVASESFTTKPAGEASVPSQPGRVARSVNLRIKGNLGFIGTCGPGFDASNAPETCGDGDKTAAASALETVYNDLIDLGFATPRLYRRPERIVVHQNIALVVPGPYVIELRPCSQPGPAGRYILSTKKAWACIGTNGFDSGRVDVVRHEYFHATQFAYPEVLAKSASYEGWWVEGQASASERSVPTLMRDSRGVRDIDVSLVSKTGKYQAQDFWIFLGMNLGRNLDYMIEFLEEGPTAQQANAAIQAEFPQEGDLGDVYWEWVKNQILEKSIDIGGGVLGNPCELETLNGDYRALSRPSSNPTGAPPVIDFNLLTPPDDASYQMEPLSSVLVQLDFMPLPNADYTARVEVISSSNDIESKFYDLNDAGTPDCVNDPDSYSLTTVIPKGIPKSYYVLIANTDLIGSAMATIRFVSPEGFQIIIPEEGAIFDEGEAISFVALASGIVDPSITFAIDWSYLRYDGVPWIMGSSGNSEMFETSSFCDGTYTVKARALLPSGVETYTDTVTITVNDMGSTNPPPQCDVSIQIDRPSNRSVHAVGQPIQFQASIQDDHPETDQPIYPVEWHLVGPVGEPFAEGLSFSSAFPEGEYGLVARYGASQDTVWFTVEEAGEEGPNTPPSAVILNPEDEAYFQENGNVPVAFTGQGTDAEDGSLSGSSLAWSYREQGGGGWTAAGTGSSTTITFPGSCDIIRYEVRLVATDSDGAGAAAVIVVRVRGPLC